MDAVPLPLLFYIGWNWRDRPPTESAIAVENVGARHQLLIGKNENVTAAVPRLLVPRRDRPPRKMRSPTENAIGIWRRGTAIDRFRLIPDIIDAVPLPLLFYIG